MCPSPAGRIRDRGTFEALRRPSGRGSNGPVRVAFVPPSAGGGTAFPLVAYAVGRQCGNAVARNRLRRRLRAVVNKSAGDLPAGSYLVAVSKEAASLPYEHLALTVCETMAEAARRARAG